MGIALVFREEGELNSLRGGKGGALAKFGGASKLIKGRSCASDSGLIVWTEDGGVTAGDGLGRAIAGTKRPIIDDQIFEVYWRGLSEGGTEGEHGAIGKTRHALFPRPLGAPCTT